MGLFTKLRNAAPAANTSLPRAVLTPAVLTMISDGSVDNSEVAQLANLCGFSPIFATTQPDALIGIINDIIRDLSSGDVNALIEQNKRDLSMPLRETAVLFAMRIAMADGRLDDGEKTALMALGQRFEIPENKFMVMFDVISILQRGPEHAA